ncbi:hypothetical protein EUX98_g9381 [Antrodiella citrinella]|uniref:Dihydrodipicolinate synthase n=1 Tax=Antrodiella citrinella TaxID=2447956 RepID=A0A4S4LU56_9APHY|nr:hypothetical protein EUX98_g9381 [Antrodiella citrinella]
MATNAVNGHAVSSARALIPGIYGPIPTFFLPGSEDLDLESFATHIVKLAKAHVYPVIAGRRRALDDAGLTEVPIVAGTGTGSTRETVELSKEAAEAGADIAIVIASGYFAGALGPKALKAFFVEVAEKSPIPVIVYNFPGASGGLDLDSDLITSIAEECPNTAGVKLTCGNVGKLTRICDTVSSASFASAYPRKNPKAPFLVFGGFIDFLLPSTYANGHGAITGLSNVAPYAIAKLYELSVATRIDSSLLPEAQRLQGIIARADFTIAKTSIAGTKALVEKLYGYGGVPRRPLLPLEADQLDALWAHPHVQDLVKLERELSGKS